MYFTLLVSNLISICFSVLYEYHEVSSGNDCQTTRVQFYFAVVCDIVGAPAAAAQSLILYVLSSLEWAFTSPRPHAT